MDGRYRNLLGYLPQDFGYYPDFSVFDYLMYIAALKGIRPAVAKERVKELLAYGDLTVSEIADKLRYSSVAHLSAQFRAQTGMSPTEFRRLKGRGLKPLDEV